jgi:hypothetical protein
MHDRQLVLEDTPNAVVSYPSPLHVDSKWDPRCTLKVLPWQTPRGSGFKPH